MNENAKKWIAALRSGTWSQAVGRLKVGTGFCCLGVACEISGLGTWDEEGYFLIDGNQTRKDVLPDGVKEWLGIENNNGMFRDADGVLFGLATLNDGGKTFGEIADIIEANADPLFKPEAA